MNTIIKTILFALSMTLTANVTAAELTEEQSEIVWSVADMTITCAVLIKQEHPDSAAVSEYTFDMMMKAVELYELARPGKVTEANIKMTTEESIKWAAEVPRETVERLLDVCYTKILKASDEEVSDLKIELDYSEHIST